MLHDLQQPPVYDTVEGPINVVSKDGQEMELCALLLYGHMEPCLGRGEQGHKGIVGGQARKAVELFTSNIQYEKTELGSSEATNFSVTLTSQGWTQIGRRLWAGCSCLCWVSAPG